MDACLFDFVGRKEVYINKSLLTHVRRCNPFCCKKLPAQDLLSHIRLHDFFNT